MSRKIRIVITVICVSAVAVVLSYPLLGLLAGDAFAFLVPGFYIGKFLPDSLAPEWLLGCDDAGPACGAFNVFIMSFLFWWLLCSVAGSFYFLRKQGVQAGT